MAFLFIILVFMAIIFLIVALRDFTSLIGDRRKRYKDELSSVNRWNKLRDVIEEGRRDFN